MSNSLVETEVLIVNLEYRLDRSQAILQAEQRDENYFRTLRDVVMWTGWLANALLIGQTNIARFFSQHINAARMQARLLGELTQSHEFAKYARQSDYLPMLGAYIAGQKDLSSQLAVASERPFQENYEYIEDYTYGGFFAQWLRHDGKLGDYIDDTLTSLERIEESGSGRYALIQSLTQGHEDFNEAMQQFTEEYDAFYASIEDTLSLDKERYTVESCISIEALAWLKIASDLQLTPYEHYRITPTLITDRL